MVKRSLKPRAKSAASKVVVGTRRNPPSISNLKLAPVVDKLVQRKINKNMNLQVQNKFGGRQQIDNLPDTSARIRKILPNILQGTAINERLGTSIRLKSLMCQGCITIPADDNVPLVNGDRADIQLRLLVLSSKTFKVIGDVEDNWTAGSTEYEKLFKVQSVAEAPTGRLSDMWKAINTENFTVHYDKVFKMQRGVGYFPDVTSTSGAAHMPAINKPFKINIKCKNKQLKYTDANDSEANNFAPFMIATWAYTNGSPPSNAGVPFYEHYVTMKYFND